MDETCPSVLRLAAGLLLASAVAAAMIALASSTGMPLEEVFEWFAIAFLFGLPVALAHAVLLGLPAYLALRRHWPLRRWNAALSGFVVGAMPLTLLALSVAVGSPSPAGALGAGEHYPAEVWLGFLWAVAFAGSVGLVGGLVFWLTVRPKP